MEYFEGGRAVLTAFTTANGGGGGGGGEREQHEESVCLEGGGRQRRVGNIPKKRVVALVAFFASLSFFIFLINKFGAIVYDILHNEKVLVALYQFLTAQNNCTR
jgi:hypothetical protein